MERPAEAVLHGLSNSGEVSRSSLPHCEEFRSDPAVRAVHRVYPCLISPTFERLLRRPGDPIWRQVVPDPKELQESGPLDREDPLGEEARSPVPNLVHRYPDRVLWLVSSRCALHCRFCTRKRRWTNPVPLTDVLMEEALNYLKRTPAVRDVILSGGDPLMLPLERLERIMARLREIPHVRIVRIGTRVPFAAPERITGELVALLRRFSPVYMNIHVNHPVEITPEARSACARLADAGVPLGSQTVLLRHLNDAPNVLEELFVELLTLRVRPYYLLQMDLMRSTAHFRVPLSRGLELMRVLRNRIPGLAMPLYVLDLPGGLGKVPLLPDAVEAVTEDCIRLRNHEGKIGVYPLESGEKRQLEALLGRTA